jgi:hypothetical protein
MDETIYTLLDKNFAFTEIESADHGEVSSNASQMKAAEKYGTEGNTIHGISSTEASLNAAKTDQKAAGQSFFSSSTFYLIVALVGGIYLTSMN